MQDAIREISELLPSNTTKYPASGFEVQTCLCRMCQVKAVGHRKLENRENFLHKPRRIITVVILTRICKGPLIAKGGDK